MSKIQLVQKITVFTIDQLSLVDMLRSYHALFYVALYHIYIFKTISIYIQITSLT